MFDDTLKKVCNGENYVNSYMPERVQTKESTTKTKSKSLKLLAFLIKLLVISRCSLKFFLSGTCGS